MLAYAHWWTASQEVLLVEICNWPLVILTLSGWIKKAPGYPRAFCEVNGVRF